MTDDTTAFGRPIHGDITKGADYVEQGDPQDWINALDAVLALPQVTAVRWRAYTPYFNDGDPCVYSVYGTGFLLDGLEADPEYNDGIGDHADNFADVYTFKYEPEKVKELLGDTDISEDGELFRTFKEFQRINENGTQYQMLNTTFGDPCIVTATADGFNVEFYEHD